MTRRTSTGRIFLFDTVRPVHYYSCMPKPHDPDADEGWEYGDVWKEGSPDDVVPDGETVFVELFRTDTAHGYDDSALLELVSYLGSRGIRATYDSFSVGMEPAAMKTYALKVDAAQADEAREALRQKFRNEGEKG